MTPVKLPPRPRRGHPYPTKYMRFARALADRGYHVAWIQAAFVECGIDPPPKHDTVSEWVDPDRAESRRIGRRTQMGHAFRSPRRSWRRKLDRMHELRDAGLSYRHVGVVMNLDFGLQLNTDSKGDQIRRVLQGRMAERNVRKLLTGGQTQRRLNRSADA